MQCLKIPALGPVGMGGFKAGAIRARHAGRQVPALVLLEGDVRDPAGCRSPGPTLGFSLCSLRSLDVPVRTGAGSRRACAILATGLRSWSPDCAPWLYLGEK